FRSKEDPCGLGRSNAEAALPKVRKTTVAYAPAPQAPYRMLIVQHTAVLVSPVPGEDPFVLEIPPQFGNELWPLIAQQGIGRVMRKQDQPPIAALRNEGFEP